MRDVTFPGLCEGGCNTVIDATTAVASIPPRRLCMECAEKIVRGQMEDPAPLTEMEKREGERIARKLGIISREYH